MKRKTGPDVQGVVSDIMKISSEALSITILY